MIHYHYHKLYDTLAFIIYYNDTLAFIIYYNDTLSLS